MRRPHIFGTCGGCDLCAMRVARALPIFALVFLTGCAALAEALPFLAPAVAAGTHGAAEIVAAKESAAKCEAGRAKTARDIADLRKRAERIESYVRADAAQEHVDAGALPMADAGADASAP